ncbi:FHA domain-containing protein [Verrucomicrobiaceae bacterium N1E253]|uniref:FHA domain-containing protein n=1 Tax=Oceaniferula marina TaxID=2748318 RepID=A0A851GHJ8_9BACT|nr:FHA domain-containing protein [Oceaniferula marina]NWK54080.1 FHA domain-containing protein [Oceaniferula marina]
MDSDADKTRMIRRSRPASDAGTPATPPKLPDTSHHDPDATRIIQPNQAPQPSLHQVPETGGIDDDATRLIAQPNPGLDPGAPQSAGVDDSDKTKLVRRSSGGAASVATTGSSQGPGTSMDDPVTGWLVVIDGPGKGNQVAIGEQDNHVGRSGGADGARVCLDFGDHGISRNNAFVLRYDPKKRRFKILPGEGANIVYLNDDDLDVPTEIKAGDVIELSDTKLRFVPFCGPEFDWVDTE